MRTSYKQLTDEEYNVLNKIARKTKMDCWFSIKQDCHGVDYIYDLEGKKRICLRTGIGELIEGVTDNDYLTPEEDYCVRGLLIKLRLH